MTDNEGRFLIDQKSLVKTTSICDESSDVQYLNAIIQSVMYVISNDTQTHATFDDSQNSPTLTLLKLQ